MIMLMFDILFLNLEVDRADVDENWQQDGSDFEDLSNFFKFSEYTSNNSIFIIAI
jgi:hypothetical protein